MLRLLFVAACVITGGLFSLKGPFETLLFYLWYAYFRPEAWLWNGEFLTSLKISLLIGIVLVFSTVFRGLRGAQLNRQMPLLLLFLGWNVASIVGSSYADDAAFASFDEFAKSIVVSIAIMILVNDRDRFRQVLLIICLSLGFEAAKQGWAQLLLDPGAKNFNKHPFLGDNNGVAVGMLMLVPVFGVLAATARTRATRWLHRFLVVGVLYRAFSTYSRGGFLAAGALVAAGFAHSPHKFRLALSGGIVVTVLLAAFPAAFWSRMATIPTSNSSAQQESEDLVPDGSIAGRLHFWATARSMAVRYPVLGVGHASYPLAYDDFDTTAGEFGPDRAVHSAWFGVLAELGYPGFVLFIAIMLVALADCISVRRIASRHEELVPLGRYANALVAALAAEIVGSSFVSIQYSEMLFHYVALAAALRLVAKREAASVMVRAEAEEEKAVVRRWSAVPSGAAY